MTHANSYAKPFFDQAVIEGTNTFSKITDAITEHATKLSTVATFIQPTGQSYYKIDALADVSNVDTLIIDCN